MGAKIKAAGTNEIEIEGVKKLKGKKTSVIILFSGTITLTLLDDVILHIQG